LRGFYGDNGEDAYFMQYQLQNAVNDEDLVPEDASISMED
jgi:hypothetical protein